MFLSDKALHLFRWHMGCAQPLGAIRMRRTRIRREGWGSVGWIRTTDRMNDNRKKLRMIKTGKQFLKDVSFCFLKKMLAFFFFLFATCTQSCPIVYLWWLKSEGRPLLVHQGKDYSCNLSRRRKWVAIVDEWCVSRRGRTTAILFSFFSDSTILTFFLPCTIQQFIFCVSFVTWEKGGNKK